MADSKVSALTSATSIGGSDLLYLIQSNTSKKITAGTLFANAGNVTLSGNINIGGTPQTLSSPGLVSLTTPITHLTADATGGTLQLPQGTNGQLKILSLISTSGGSYAINPANVAASANIVLNSSGDSVWLLFTNNKWYVIGDKQSDVVTSVNGSTGSVTLTTSNITESGNLYYTNARVYSNVSQIGYLTAASLAGYATNNQLSAYATTAQLGVYATNAQISGFASTSDLTTANVSEVTNLYFTNARAVGALTAGTGIVVDSNGLLTVTVTGGGDASGVNSDSDIYITNGHVSGPDIFIQSGDDIFIRGRDKTSSDSEGGDINIEAGEGGPADSGDPGGSGGDIDLRAGEGGAPSGNYEGGSGGYISLRAGLGASANTDASISANDGGYIQLIAGSAGSNGGTFSRGATGGYIYLTAGNSTNQNQEGGIVRLTSGQGGPNAYAGNIELVIPSSDLGSGGTWNFAADGILATPGDVNIDGGLTISQTSITGNRDFSTVNINSAPNPNAYVQLNETGDSFFGAESNVVIYSYGDTYEWKFGSDSILTLPGNLHFSGCSISAINSVSNSSGDGIGASTLQIVPDNTLFNNDQYIIIDPTEPDHIHIRGGGAIDNCSAKLIFGGENSHIAVNPGANSSISIRADNNNWNFGTDGTLVAPGSISSSGIVSTGKSKFNKIVESYSGLVNPTGNATVDCTNSHVFNVTSINANFTANIVNLDLNDGEATSVTLILNQGASAYIANVVQISGVAQTIKWQANAQPTGNVNAVDIQTLSIVNVGGNYTVLGQLTTFG